MQTLLNISDGLKVLGRDPVGLRFSGLGFDDQATIGTVTLHYQLTGLALEDWQGKAETHCAHDARHAASPERLSRGEMFCQNTDQE